MFATGLMFGLMVEVIKRAMEAIASRLEAIPIRSYDLMNELFTHHRLATRSFFAPPFSSERHAAIRPHSPDHRASFDGRLLRPSDDLRSGLSVSITAPFSISLIIES